MNNRKQKIALLNSISQGKASIDLLKDKQYRICVGKKGTAFTINGQPVDSGAFYSALSLEPDYGKRKLFVGYSREASVTNLPIKQNQ